MTSARCELWHWLSWGLPTGCLPETCPRDCLQDCGDGFCTHSENANTCPEDCPADCGDGFCTHNESGSSCPEDCPLTCGDGVCNGEETAVSCPRDCPPFCGDGVCTHSETPATCAQDCPAECGDGACTHDENASTCSVDCPEQCGDGLCTHTENASSCPRDCPERCGDGFCTHSENAATCPEDCPPICRDRFCTHGENAATCPADCPEVCSDGFCTHTETPITCAEDCPAVCGDRACTHSENASTCPRDCPADWGDGFCTHTENVNTCPEDCPIRCGDLICSGDENANSCPSDCPAACGDGYCTHDESPASCPDDCGCVLGTCCYSQSLVMSLPQDAYAGQLSTGDPRGGPRGSDYYFDDIEFEAEAGDPVVIETISASFDTFLYLLDENCQVVAWNDDHSGTTLSRIDYTPPTSGVYTVVVTSSHDSTTGSYTIELNSGPTCTVGECCYGDTLRLDWPSDSYAGQLSTGDAQGGPRGSDYYFDDIEFEAEAGVTFVVETTAGSFDTYLYLLDENCQIVAWNDDRGGGSTLSRIEYTAPTSGVYTVVVTSYRDSTTGSYTIELNSGPTCTVGECCYGDTLTLDLPSDAYPGQLTTGDAQGGPRGSSYYFDDIEFYAAARTYVEIETTAGTFDTYLYLLNANCEVIASNDDAPGTTLSLISYELPTSGVYTIVVTTRTAGALGSYTVELNEI